MRKDCVVIHYSEIGLKGKNRPYFEKKLESNIKKKTGLKVRRESGRLVMEYKRNKTNALSEVPGIAYYAPAVTAKLQIKDFIKKAEALIRRGSFRVSAKRSNKKFKRTSIEVNKKVGEALHKKGLKVNLDNPKNELIIEIGNKQAYLYTKKKKGLGGLPVGVTGKVIALVSGGIDSPVACYEMMRRGCEVIIVHFYNQKQGVKEKIQGIAKKLSKIQGPIKVYTIPFLDIQRDIIMKVPADHRMITYRRLMLLIASELMAEEKALGLVTGDNLGQVASQTLENLKVIWRATKENVYAPLLTKDKQGIIRKAKEIKTYKISIKPYSDCCSYLVAKHPVTKARLKNVEKLERNIDKKLLVQKALKNKEKTTIK